MLFIKWSKDMITIVIAIIILNLMDFDCTNNVKNTKRIIEFVAVIVTALQGIKIMLPEFLMLDRFWKLIKFNWLNCLFLRGFNRQM